MNFHSHRGKESSKSRHLLRILVGTSSRWAIARVEVLGKASDTIL